LSGAGGEVQQCLSHQIILIEAAVLTVGLCQPDVTGLLLPFHSDDVIVWTFFSQRTLFLHTATHFRLSYFSDAQTFYSWPFSHLLFYFSIFFAPFLGYFSI
jgi:hypothetical protein